VLRSRYTAVPTGFFITSTAAAYTSASAAPEPNKEMPYNPRSSDPGHGEKTTIGREKQFNYFLQGL
jgi:hypothetical protein